MSGVEETHGVDFSGGIPAGYEVLGMLLDSVIEGVEPTFELVKLEGDAVFASAPAQALDGHGADVLNDLNRTYAGFLGRRHEARHAHDHVCVACNAVTNLDLKMVLHRGTAVRQRVGAGTDLLGPAVNVAHRLLKNTVRAQIGLRPYLLVTDAAATSLGLADAGLPHREEYDIGPITGRIIELDARSAPSAA
jgi:hypothetical protein